MAGYLGTKAVLLSTTAANVGGNAEIGGDLTVGGAFTSQGIDDNASATAMTLDASGNVGIGTSSSSTRLHVKSSGGVGTSSTFETDAPSSTINFINTGSSTNAYLGSTGTSLFFATNNAERMRIDSSGNLLVGTTTSRPAEFSHPDGFAVRADVKGQMQSTVTNEACGLFNRDGTDGNILGFRKEGTDVGSIGVGGGSFYVGQGDSGLGFFATDNIIFPANVSAQTNRDNAIDLGYSNGRFNDIYATNGTIQTSDRNEKQDIEALSDAEQRVAVACKGLLRKFRWKDAVAEKGDDARIHFGIIAQDLQDAFAAEGLDAGRYAMFISSTWWETQTEVPAVEAVAEVLDEEGNVVTEAVEAKDAYTRTDTYETLEEAPEGATERTRLGVRYPELLAFIIGAM